MVHEYFNYLNNNPISGFLQFVIVWILAYEGLLRLSRAWLQFCRMLSIRKHGWPPPHVDADGDPISKDS